jgi:pilus assembly protein Flp/PilA
MAAQNDLPGVHNLRLVLTSYRHYEGKEDQQMIQQFFRDEEGQGLVEYALIIAVIAIAVIVAMIFLRGQIENIFSNIGNNLT